MLKSTRVLSMLTYVMTTPRYPIDIIYISLGAVRPTAPRATTIAPTSRCDRSVHFCRN